MNHLFLFYSLICYIHSEYKQSCLSVVKISEKKKTVSKYTVIILLISHYTYIRVIQYRMYIHKMSTLCNFGIYYNLSMRAYTLCIYIKILYNILQLTLLST